MNGLFFILVMLPALAGILFVASSFVDHSKITNLTGGKENIPEEGNLSALHGAVALILGISMASVLYLAWTGEREFVLFQLMEDVPIYFHIDAIGRIFSTIVTIVWALAGIFSFVYMKHEGEEKRYFGFFMIVYSVLILLDFSGNLITMYCFYEMMTLTALPLVFHNGSREAIMATLKYLFYSMCGAYLGLFGIFTLYRYCDSLVFTTGGTLSAAAVEHKGILLIAIFCMLIGFGAKAGMFPLHGWLPAAHPVAPSPASAVLSGLIVKSGVLCIIRSVFYIVGPDFIRGTWVQYAWMTLALLTVFMGSMMAYLEPIVKKRLAYSTVSQISYILFGLAVLNEDGFVGALLHVICHAFIKSGLFLSAGVFLFCLHKTRVEELKGIGKKMPVFLWCWTFFSLALVGIPPFGGFVSKWYLAAGSLNASIGIFRYLGPVILLISALLTAGYLLPVTMNGFLPGEDYEEITILHPFSKGLAIPLLVLAALSLVLGLFPNPILGFLTEIARTIL
ncbi:MAG: proton-conducting transporter membrane subunit [Eubacteriales bacterium]|nr:proton-conducting transporter membrane subunit [Eubacteriales bacterium]